jgi:hypothetical protein
VVWWFAHGFSILQHHLTLDVAHWLSSWACGLLRALFLAAPYHLSAVSPSAFPVFTESSSRDQLLVLPPFSSVLTAPRPICCVFLLSSLFIIQGFFCLFFFFCEVGESVCPGGYAGLFQGWLWEYGATPGAQLLACQMSPKQIWSPISSLFKSFTTSSTLSKLCNLSENLLLLSNWILTFNQASDVCSHKRLSLGCSSCSFTFFIIHQWCSWCFHGIIFPTSTHLSDFKIWHQARYFNKLQISHS